MFWTIFVKLCALKGLSPNKVAKELHIASGTVSEWKKGRTPQNATLKKIADYFGVSVEYLKGETDEKSFNNSIITYNSRFVNTTKGNYMSITIQRIRQLAEDQGISLSFLCKKLGLSSRTYFQDVEKRNADIPIDKLAIIANALNTTIEYLKGETDEKGPTKETQATILPLFSNEEISIIYAYRAQPELQSAVKRLLGFTEGTAYDAAESKSQPFEKQKLVESNSNRSAKLHKAPEEPNDIM